MSEIRDLLLDSVERMMTERCTQAVVDAAESAWPEDLWNVLEEAGLPLACVPEEAGGGGATLGDGLAVVRRAARSAAPVPLVGTGGAPLFDVRHLVRSNVGLSYLVDYLQVFSQVGMMFSVPLYFQVTQRATSGSAGARIVPAVVANTAGALSSARQVRPERPPPTLLSRRGPVGRPSDGC